MGKLSLMGIRQIISLLTFCLILFMPMEVFTQSYEKLRATLNTSSSPKLKSQAAIKLGNRFSFENQDSSLHYFDIAERLTTVHKLDSLYIATLIKKGKLASQKTDYDAAINYLRKAKGKATQKGITRFDDHFLNQFGQYFTFSQVYDSAVYYILKYDDWLVSNQLEKKRWIPHINLAVLYLNLKDHEKVSLNLAKALDFARIQKKPMDYLFVLQEAIRIEKQYANFELVSNLTEEYLDFKLNNQGSSVEEILEISHHSHMRTPGMDDGDLEKSLLNYIPKHAEANNLLSLANATFNLGNIYLDQQKPLLAIQVFKQGLEAADSLQSIAHQSNMHRALYRSYKAAKMFEIALEHSEIANFLQRKIQNIEGQKQVRDLKVKHETAKKEMALDKANFELNASKQKQRILWLGLSALTLLLGLSIYAYRNKRKSSQLLLEKNELISKALKEKDILLKEIHHRVKNNLQMVSALLYLQGKSIDDATAKDAIKESENRVQSMAMIHQKLYQDENLLGVDVKDYLDRLFDHLFDSYNIDGQRITLNKSIELENLDIDTVIPLALIVNELVSNSLKYAFKDGRSGEIKVTLKEANEVVTLRVEDNGIGLPEGFDKEKTINFGYKLINILSGKLGGDWSINNDHGTSIHFTFPKAA